MYHMPLFRVPKVGNSLGVLFPKEFVAEKHLKVNDEVRVDVERTGGIESTFGILKHLETTVEEMMAEIDEGERD